MLHGYIRAHEEITSHFSPDEAMTKAFETARNMARARYKYATLLACALLLVAHGGLVSREIEQEFVEVVIVIETLMAAKILLQLKRQKIKELGRWLFKRGVSPKLSRSLALIFFISFSRSRPLAHSPRALALAHSLAHSPLSLSLARSHRMFARFRGRAHREGYEAPPHSHRHTDR